MEEYKKEYNILEKKVKLYIYPVYKVLVVRFSEELDTQLAVEFCMTAKVEIDGSNMHEHTFTVKKNISNVDEIEQYSAEAEKILTAEAQKIRDFFEELEKKQNLFDFIDFLFDYDP